MTRPRIASGAAVCTAEFVAVSRSSVHAPIGSRNAHVRRLEQAVGRPLFVRDTRSVTLTADGEVMAGFARSILAAHEQAVAYFTGSGLSGRLRFGVTDDLALTPVPRILRDFRQLYPRIDLELTVSQSGTLDLVLLTNPHSATEPAEALTAAILASGHPVKSRQD